MTDGITAMYDEMRLAAQITHEQQGEDFGLAEDDVEIISDLWPNVIQTDEISPELSFKAAERERHSRAVERLLEYLKSTR